VAGERPLDAEDPCDAAAARAPLLEILSGEPQPTAAVRKRIADVRRAGGGCRRVETIGAINDLVHEALRATRSSRLKEVRVASFPPR